MGEEAKKKGGPRQGCVSGPVDRGPGAIHTFAGNCGFEIELKHASAGNRAYRRRTYESSAGNLHGWRSRTTSYTASTMLSRFGLEK